MYRARDLKLGRSVAIKVLPPAFVADPDRRARFEQEAYAASALNHPNIVTIHDLESAADAAQYVAMELVEGRTLRELLEAGLLPTKKLLDIAVQVADGLAKAHAAGIVHRDLKPENLIVSNDGFVKILDFGLAKLVGAPAESVGNTRARMRVTFAGSSTMASSLIRPWHLGQAWTSTAKVRAKLRPGAVGRGALRPAGPLAGTV